MLDLAVAIPTLIGSALSMTAAGFVFLCYLLLPSQMHFRHTLIINLAAADFINGLNNTVSGTYALIHRTIPPGFACNMNGLVGQMTVQGTDFSILAIAIATVITIRRSSFKPSMSYKRKLLVTCGIWLVPVSTSATGLMLGAYQPVTGNWCWLEAKRPVLRYALGHGWRITIILTVICLYIYLFIYIERHFSMLEKIHPPQKIIDHLTHTEEIQVYEDFVIEETYQYEDDCDDTDLSYGAYAGSATDKPRRELEGEIRPLSPCREIVQKLHLSKSKQMGHHELRTSDPLALVRRPMLAPLYLPTVTTTCTSQPTLQYRKKKIQTLLLLNAYPVACVLLWVPGLANRAFESLGYSARWIRILQASTQFVGLANACVYGYNERIVAWTILWWKGKRVSQRQSNYEGMRWR